MDDDQAEPPVQRQLAAAPVFKAPKQVSRPKPVVQQDEEFGAEPKLGDFADVHALSVSEARYIISAVHESRKKKDPGNNPLGGDRVHNDSQTITQFLEYLENFSRYKDAENLHSLDAILHAPGNLDSVERAMLGSLACDSADEAKTLIPSLQTKLGDEQLNGMLDQMQKLQDRYG